MISFQPIQWFNALEKHDIAIMQELRTEHGQTLGVTLEFICNTSFTRHRLVTN